MTAAPSAKLPLGIRGRADPRRGTTGPEGSVLCHAARPSARRGVHRPDAAGRGGRLRRDARRGEPAAALGRSTSGGGGRRAGAADVAVPLPGPRYRLRLAERRRVRALEPPSRVAGRGRRPGAVQGATGVTETGGPWAGSVWRAPSRPFGRQVIVADPARLPVAGRSRAVPDAERGVLRLGRSR